MAGESASLPQIAKLLKARLGAAAAKVPTRTLPDWLVRLIALFNAEIALIAPELGKTRNASNEKARRVLGWRPKSNEEALLATAESLLAERAA